MRLTHGHQSLQFEPGLNIHVSKLYIMNVQQVANELEILLLGLVDSRGDNSVNERIDQAKACLGKLIAAHDAAQASEVKPAVDLEGHLNNFPDAAYPLEEKRSACALSCEDWKHCFFDCGTPAVCGHDWHAHLKAFLYMQR